MEYNVLNNGDLVPSWQPRYLPDAVPPSRQNMKVVLLPTQYQGMPEHPYQNHRVQEVAYANFQSPPRNLPTIQHQHLQTQSMPYQGLQEGPYQNLQATTSQSFQVPTNIQAQNSAPVQSIENMIAYSTSGSHNAPTGQDSRQTDENLDIVMQGLEERATDALSDTTCSTCGGYKYLKSSIERLSSSQKQATKAWAEFAKDVVSDIDERKLWRNSIEEKIDRLLERSNGGGISDLGILT